CSQPSSPETSRIAPPAPPRTGERLTVKAWPATPSETPSGSLSTTSACSASTVPPTVPAASPCTSGADVYAGSAPSHAPTPARSQPALAPSSTAGTWDPGTCTTSGPDRFSPPVSSPETSHSTQPLSVSASHTRGGSRGSTPTPSTCPRKSTRTAHRGTGLD